VSPVRSVSVIGEHYRNTRWSDRFAVRWIVPFAVVAMFDTIVHPNVYPTVGLPAIPTWLRVRRQPPRIALRQQCARAVLRALLDAGVVAPAGIPLPWRYAAAVDDSGHDRARRSNAAELVGTAAQSIWRPAFASLRWSISAGVGTVGRLSSVGSAGHAHVTHAPDRDGEKHGRDDEQPHDRGAALRDPLAHDIARHVVEEADERRA
jgi:hypothetical protein